MDPNYLEVQRRKNHSNKKFRIIFFIASGLFLLSLIGIFKIISVWKVDNIEITGNQRVSSEKIKNDLSLYLETTLRESNFILKFLGTDNLFIWVSADWNEFLKNNASLASLESRFNLLEKSVSFEIKESSPWAIWCAEDNCFWFDEFGKIIEVAPDTYGKLLLKVEDNSKRDLSIGDLILKNKIFALNLVKILSLLKDSKLPINKIILNRMELAELSVFLENGPRIDFSLRFGFSLDKNEFISMIQKINQPGGGGQNLEYIDLRVENRIYYK